MSKINLLFCFANSFTALFVQLGAGRATLGGTVNRNVTYDGDDETVAVASSGASVASLKERFREVKPFEGSGQSRVGFAAAPLNCSDIIGNFACCSSSAGLRASHVQFNWADVAKAAVGKDVVKYLLGTLSRQKSSHIFCG